MWEKILGFLFPKQCISCGKYGVYLCDYCRDLCITFQKEKVCHVCKNKIIEGYIHNSCKELTYLDSVQTCVLYSELVRKILEEIKYKYYHEYVEVVVDLMMQVIDIENYRNSIFIPVPLSKFKLKKRGFNQAQLIAKKIAMKLKELGIDIQVVEVLERSKNTKTQVGMTREERLENLKDVFKLNSKFQTLKSQKGERQNIESRKLILIDDVMTTGTTLEECAKVLKKGGIKEVKALVFARG